MSYAGSTPRAASARPASRDPQGPTIRALPTSGGPSAMATPSRGPAIRSRSRDVGMLAIGMTIGAVIATGITLLFAPRSGAETRAALVDRGRKVKTRTRDAWDDLRDELAVAAYRKKRQLNRRRARA